MCIVFGRRRRRRRVIYGLQVLTVKCDRFSPARDRTGTITRTILQHSCCLCFLRLHNAEARSRLPVDWVALGRHLVVGELH